jgi:hypothetical protein
MKESAQEVFVRADIFTPTEAQIPGKQIKSKASHKGGDDD